MTPLAAHAADHDPLLASLRAALADSRRVAEAAAALDRVARASL